MIPMFVRLKITGEEGRSINLFIPMILLYILLLPLLIIALPFVIIASGLSGSRWLSGEMIFAFIALFSAVRGTEIEVKDKKSEVILKIF